MYTKQCKSKYHTGNRTTALEDMTKDKHRVDGYSDTCKMCARARKKDWLSRVYSGEEGVQSLKEMRMKHVTQIQNRRKELGLEYCLWKSAKERAAKTGREFTIEVKDVTIPNVCPVLGIPLVNEVVVHAGTSQRPPNYPTIDRIDSSGGYTPNNIIVVSWRANSLKNNATLEEMVALGRFAATLLHS